MGREKGRVRLGGCNGEEEGGNGNWEMGRGQQEGEMGKGTNGRGEEGARGEGITQMDMMKCLGGMRLQFFLTLITHATPGTPASLFINSSFPRNFP